ncbi:MAG: shikimate dehydrogenase [Actinomycetota bacterium]|nr:shikimate dehydrogenase [Actinomycetota bacterium]
MRPRGTGHITGVLGWPLEHTLSPAIHNAAFRHLGLDWIYLPFPVRPELLADSVRGLVALGAMGANVTMPHKESIIPLLHDISGDARAVGAVNTLQRIGDRLIGHNTDVDGFREFLVGDAGVRIEGKRALVLGSGGAARAVVKALDDLGASKIVIAARDPGRGSSLVRLVRPGTARVEPWDRGEAIARESDVIVNATPLGTRSANPLPGVRFGPGQAVIDLVYTPPSTALVEAARAGGADGWGGLGMLVHQAAASFRIWTGQDPPIEAMSAAAVHSIGSRALGAGSTVPRRVPKDEEG